MTSIVADPPYRIKVRGRDQIPTGEIQRLTALTLTPRFDDVGSWSVVIPRDHPQSQLLEVQGGWVSFLSGDTEICSGQIRGLKRNWSATDVGSGTLTAYGPTSESIILDRLAYQVPTSAATAQGAAAYDTQSDVGETVIKHYVDFNAGPSALAARQIEGLVIEADLGRGGAIKASARMDNLLAFIQPLAETAGLGFRVRFEAGHNLIFEMFEPVDRSGTAKFGRELGNLESYEHVVEAAKSSDVVVGGSGDGTARIFREIIDTPSIDNWSVRAETFIDRRDSSDTVELDQAGTEETVTNGPVVGLSIKTVDTPNLMFGRDYFLGDKVAIPEFGIIDVLREVEINWKADDSPSTQSTVGTRSSTGTQRMADRLAVLTEKVAKLQADK